MSEITGVAELKRALLEFEPNFRKRVLRGALRAGAKEMLAAMRGAVDGIPIKQEARERLKRSLTVFGSVRAAPGTVVVGIGLRSLPADNGRAVDDPRIWQVWLEKGTIERVRSKGGKTGRIVAMPHARNGLDAAQSAIDAATDYCVRRFEDSLT